MFYTPGDGRIVGILCAIASIEILCIILLLFSFNFAMIAFPIAYYGILFFITYVSRSLAPNSELKDSALDAFIRKNQHYTQPSGYDDEDDYGIPPRTYHPKQTTPKRDHKKEYRPRKEYRG